MENAGEIYMLTNKVNGKRYIGQTRCVGSDGRTRGAAVRFQQHVSAAKRNEKGCRFLMNAMRKHGPENFEVEVLVVVHVSQLDDMERKLISQYDTCNPKFGYNLMEGGYIGDSEYLKQAASKAAKEMWKDPEYREVMTDKVKKQWEDPAFREKVESGVKRASQARWKDPEIRKRIVEGISRTQKVNNGQADLPMYLRKLREKGEDTGYYIQCKGYRKYFRSRKVPMEKKLQQALECLEKLKVEGIL